MGVNAGLRAGYLLSNRGRESFPRMLICCVSTGVDSFRLDFDEYLKAYCWKVLA